MIKKTVVSAFFVFILSNPFGPASAYYENCPHCPSFETCMSTAANKWAKAMYGKDGCVTIYNREELGKL